MRNIFQLAERDPKKIFDSDFQDFQVIKNRVIAGCDRAIANLKIGNIPATKKRTTIPDKWFDIREDYVLVMLKVGQIPISIDGNEYQIFCLKKLNRKNPIQIAISAFTVWRNKIIMGKLDREISIAAKLVKPRKPRSDAGKSRGPRKSFIVNSEGVIFPSH